MYKLSLFTKCKTVQPIHIWFCNTFQLMEKKSGLNYKSMGICVPAIYDLFNIIIIWLDVQ